MSGLNGIGWLEIGTDDPAAAERFDGDVFECPPSASESPWRMGPGSCVRPARRDAAW